MMSLVAAGGAQQSISGGITVIIYDSFDRSFWYAPSVCDQYPFQLNQTLLVEVSNTHAALGTTFVIPKVCHQVLVFFPYVDPKVSNWRFN